jgi:hypothetical protein
VKQLRDILPPTAVEHIENVEWDFDGRYTDPRTRFVYCPLGLGLNTKSTTPGPWTVILRLGHTETDTDEYSTVRTFMNMVDKGYPVDRALNLPVSWHDTRGVCCNVCTQYIVWLDSEERKALRDAASA